MISINATLVVQIINFLIILFILNKILFRPILKGLEARQELIEGNKARAIELRQRGEDKLREYDRSLAEARNIAMSKQVEIRNEGMAKASEILDSSKKQEAEIIAEIQRGIASEVAEAKKDIQAYADSLSKDVTKKILGRAIR